MKYSHPWLKISVGSYDDDSISIDIDDRKYSYFNPCYSWDIYGWTIDYDNFLYNWFCTIDTSKDFESLFKSIYDEFLKFVEDQIFDFFELACRSFIWAYHVAEYYDYKDIYWYKKTINTVKKISKGPLKAKLEDIYINENS